MVRPRSWDDKSLSTAVTSARTWNDVVKGVGRRPSARATRSVQGHALRLEVPIQHLPPVLDGVVPLESDWTARKGTLPEAVASSRSWAEVMRALGCENSGSAWRAAKRLAAELGLDTSHIPPVWNRRAIVPSSPLPFAAPPDDRGLSAAAIGEAIAWFLRRGYAASVPVEPTRYDLVVESDEGFKRVQVKSSTRRDPSGRWIVRIGRMQYDGNGTSGSNGKRRGRPYAAGEVDLFLIVTGDRSIFLIPIDLVSGQVALTLDRKYAAYKVQ
jgi:hypothetical protein